MERSNISYSIHLQQQTGAFFYWLCTNISEESVKESGPYVNMSVKTEHNDTYPDIKGGENVYIYMIAQEPSKVSHITLSDIAYEVEDLAHSHRTTV